MNKRKKWKTLLMHHFRFYFWSL
uniref:Uncharacterized protein n=1 Tax=Rhizophora mucronata TaxID=61149 RepID=A0A2P2PZ54_RHIMU